MDEFEFSLYSSAGLHFLLLQTHISLKCRFFFYCQHSGTISVYEFYLKTKKINHYFVNTPTLFQAYLIEFSTSQLIRSAADLW